MKWSGRERNIIVKEEGGYIVRVTDSEGMFKEERRS